MYRRLRYGYTFRLIRMAQPKYAKVDPADYKRLRRYEWFSIKGTCNFYAVRRARGPKATRFTTIYMHRELIEVADRMLTDHVNQNSMDNRRANLRAATRAQNVRNHKGWIARIMFEQKKIHLG